MAGITSMGIRLLAPTTITKTSKTAQFYATSLHSKVRFQCPKFLSKSDSLISLSRSSSSSVVTSAHVSGDVNLSSGDSRRSGQVVFEEGNDKLKQATNFADMAMVGMSDMEKGMSAIEYFCMTNFTFHGLDVNSPQTVFKFLPILLYTECYIYEMDCLNEYLTNLANNRDAIVKNRRKLVGEEESWTPEQIELFKTDPFGPLASQLESRGLLTERIKEQFRGGVEYWNLEAKLCSALSQRKEISIDDVNRVMKLRSTDFRILNLLLYQLRGEEVNDLHMEFLSHTEYLVEVYDDMLDYEDDVIRNNFNILRCYVGIYGPSEAPAMLAKSMAEAQEKSESLSKAVDPKLILNFQRRLDEMVASKGMDMSDQGDSSGMAIIPPVIVDEGLYRSNFFK